MSLQWAGPLREETMEKLQRMATADYWIESDPVWQRLRNCSIRPKPDWNYLAQYVCSAVLTVSLIGMLYYGVRCLMHYRNWAWILGR